MSNSSKSIYSGKVVKLFVDEVDLPGRGRATIEVIRHPGGAGALAFDESMRVCLLRQYRHAVGGYIWEVPAGKADVPGESTLELAKRELMEEAGIVARTVIPLGSFLSTPGFCDELLDLYMAKDISFADTRHSPNEIIEAHWFDFEVALKMADTGEITDGKTLFALYKAARMLENE